MSRISTLKEFVAEKYRIHQKNTATAEKKWKKNQHKEKMKNMKGSKLSLVSIGNINSSTSKQKLMTFLKMDRTSATDANEDSNAGKSVPDPLDVGHSINEKSETDSRLPLKEQGEVMCDALANMDNFGHSPSAINAKTQTDSQLSSKNQHKMFCDV